MSSCGQRSLWSAWACAQSESSLGAQAILLVLSWCGSIIAVIILKFAKYRIQSWVVCFGSRSIVLPAWSGGYWSTKGRRENLWLNVIITHSNLQSTYMLIFDNFSSIFFPSFSCIAIDTGKSDIEMNMCSCLSIKLASIPLKSTGNVGFPAIYTVYKCTWSVKVE